MVKGKKSIKTKKVAMKPYVKSAKTVQNQKKSIVSKAFYLGIIMGATTFFGIWLLKLLNIIGR